MSPSSLRHRNLPLMLLQAREALMANFRPLLAEFGLTDQQWRVVRALFDAGELEPRQISQLCQISSPSITGVLVRMEDVGLVLRQAMPGDRRRLRVSLTAEGRRIARRLVPRIEAKYQELEDAVGVQTLHQAYDFLDFLLVKIDGQDTASAAED